MKQPKRKAINRKDTAPERAFDTLLSQLAPKWGKPEKNYLFDLPNSHKEIDRFWSDQGIGVEVQGGTWSRGKSGHNSGNGLERDYRKLAAAHARGIKLFFFSTTMLRDDPVWCIDQLRPWLDRNGRTK